MLLCLAVAPRASVGRSRSPLVARTVVPVSLCTVSGTIRHVGLSSCVLLSLSIVRIECLLPLIACPHPSPFPTTRSGEVVRARHRCCRLSFRWAPVRSPSDLTPTSTTFHAHGSYSFGQAPDKLGLRGFPRGNEAKRWQTRPLFR